MALNQLNITTLRNGASLVTSRVDKVRTGISNVLSGEISLFQLKNIRNKSDDVNLRNFIDTFLENYEKDPTKASLKNVIRFIETADFSRIKLSVDKTQKGEDYIEGLRLRNQSQEDFLNREKKENFIRSPRV